MKNNEEEFQAPKWVRDEANLTKDKEFLPPSKKHKITLTITLLVVFPLCLFAGWFEFGRAQSGNWRAWVYTFEWPFFGAVAIFLWRRLMKGDVPRIPRPDFAALKKLAESDEEGR